MKSPAAIAILLFTVTAMSNPLHAADLPTRESFGATKDGQPVEIYTLKNDTGFEAKVMTRGATLVELHVPDKDGRSADVILGFDDVSGYESDANQYFGCTTGRVCNRIGGAEFSLGGQTYTLAKNDNGKHHLHGGGARSLDKVVWKAEPFRRAKQQGVAFTYTSPDGEEGYPGNLSVKVTYAVPDDRNVLRISYEATTDQATPVNLTNHMYFNLGGHGSQSVLDHMLTIRADEYTVADDDLIPTGQNAAVNGTPVDFRQPTRLGARIDALTNTGAKGYDHNFVLRANRDEDRPLRSAATLKDPASGRVLEISTTEPGVQLYTGNFLFGQTGKGGKTYAHRSAVCLETQHFPDSVHHDNFPSVVLKPGQQFESITVYRFSAE
ncbi:MAG: aldose epimerase family protein [Planctomycetaceae bacterium]